MAKQRLDIPAVLVHTVDGVQYRVNGKIVGINESADTCSMKFKGYPVQDGIPMSAVYLNEGFIDKIKQYGSAAINAVKKIIKKIGGFLFPVNEDGKADVENFNVFANMCVASQEGLLPESVQLYPSAELVSEAGQKGLSLQGKGEEFLDSIEEDCKNITTYWNRVMSTYVQNESMTVSEAVKAVNERYYKTSNAWRSLNENAVASGGDPSDNMIEMDSVELADWLESNVVQQVSGTVGNHAKAKPALIWGAPGIGKTAIIRQTMDRLKKHRGLNLCFTQIACANLFREDLFLPKKVRNIIGEEIAGEMPKSWLPIYKWVEGNPEKMKEVDDFYNTGMFRYTADDFSNVADFSNDADMETVGKLAGDKCGGIIFLDEFSRLPAQAEQSIMSLVNEHHLGGLHLASKWGFVCASNRTMDTLASPEEGAMEPAMGDRFWHILYVPKMTTWLAWARQMNPRTGRQYVDEMILTFLENTMDAKGNSKIWWDCLDFGSRNNRLSDTDKDTLASEKNFDWKTNAQQIQTSGNPIVDDPNTWTPRTWTEKVGEPICNELQMMIFKDHPDLYGETEDMQNIATLMNEGIKPNDMAALKAYRGSFDATQYFSEDGEYHCGIWTNGNIDPSRLRTALNQLSTREWNVWFKDKKATIDPTNVYDRYGAFMQWIQKIHLPAALGRNALPVAEFKDFQEYKQVFTKPNIESIWETGKLGDPTAAEDDDRTFESPDKYRATSYSKWKWNTKVANGIIDDIRAGFPGGDDAMVEMALEDMPKVQAALAKGIDDATYEKLYDKYCKKYTVKLGGKSVSYLFDAGKEHPGKPAKEQAYKNMIIVLENSKLARMLVNFATYLSKISIQMHTDAQVGRISSVFPGWFAGKCKSDAALHRWVMPVDLLVSDGQDPTDNVKAEGVLSQTIWWPAMCIMTRTKNRSRKSAMNGGK